MILRLMRCDMAIFTGRWWNPIHQAIMWRSLSKYVHSVVFRNETGGIWDPTIGGVLLKDISSYEKEKVKIIRWKGDLDRDTLTNWGLRKWTTSKGYDYLAWLGFLTGLKALEDENRWFCSEFPYWMFQENGYKITTEDVTFIYPSDLARNPCFETIFEGKVKEII